MDSGEGYTEPFSYSIVHKPGTCQLSGVRLQAVHGKCALLKLQQFQLIFIWKWHLLIQNFYEILKYPHT